MSDIRFFSNLPKFTNGTVSNAKMPLPVETAVPSAVTPHSAENAIINSAKSLYEFFTNAQSAKMAGSDMSLILKDLLGMQKDIKEFLSEIVLNEKAGTITKPDLAKLLLSNQFELGKLTQFMQQNGKEALSKLFTMTANFAQSGAVAGSSQVSELIAILNACTPNADTSQAQILKNMILLYLPWLPIGEQNAFTLEIGGGKSEGEGAESEDSISVMIKTVNFGNVSVLIFKNETGSVSFNIKASKDFPKDKISEKIKQEAKEYNVQTEMSYEEKTNLKFPDKTKNAKTEVNVNMGNKINPFLILMAETVIRIIIETDKNYTLVETRKEKL